MTLRNRLCVIAALLAVPVLLGLGSHALSRPAGPPEVGDTTITIPVRDDDGGHAPVGGGSRYGGGGAAGSDDADAQRANPVDGDDDAGPSDPDDDDGDGSTEGGDDDE
jgi:hypothetical protein